MTRTMIYLEEDAHTELKYLALDQRVTMAELIRRAVHEFLKKQKKGGRR
jgi:predicted DNA-binding ribbon-helix-helix protein